MLVKSFNEKAGIGENNSWHVANDNWPWLELQDNVLMQSLAGVLFGLLFSCLILIFLTRSITTSFLSTVSIAVLISDQLVVIYYMGWTFGIIESTCIITSIGIAVDYIVHFSHSYVNSKFTSRR